MVWADLGGGVVDDGEPETGALLPVCPICPADAVRAVVENTGRAGGLLCEVCGFLFDGTVEEKWHPKNKVRREMWAEEIKPRCGDKLEELEEP